MLKESREKSVRSSGVGVNKSPSRSVGGSPTRKRRSEDTPKSPSSGIFEKKVKEITGKSDKPEVASPSPTKIIDKVSSKPLKIPGTVPPPNAGRKVVRKVNFNHFSHFVHG